MRSSLQSLTISTLLLFAALAFAQNPQGTPPPSPPSTAERLENLAQQLNLTDAQKEKIKPILEDEAKQIQGLRDDTLLTREQRFSKFKEIRENTQSQIRPLLTEEQQKKLDEIRKQSRQQPAGRGPQNRRDTQNPQ